MKKLSLGLKVNSSYISLAFTEEPKVEVRKVTFRQVEKKTGQSFEILDNTTIDRIEEQILDVEKRLQGKITQIFFCVPQDKITKVLGSSQIIIHPRRSAPVTVSDIRKAIQQARLLNLDWSLKCLHSFPLEFKLDGKRFMSPPIGVYGRRLQVKVAFYAYQEDFILNIDRVFGRLGKNYTSLMLSSLAEASSLKEKELAEANFAILNFGRDKLEFSYFKNFILHDITVFYKGGKSIDEELSEELKIPASLSEKIKISYGSLLENDLVDSRTVTIKRTSAYREIKRATLNSILSSLYKRTLEELKDYLEQKDFLREMDFIIPLGGAAKIKGFDRTLESTLALPARSVDSYISGLVKDEFKFLGSFGALKFASSKFNIEQSYKFPATFLQRIKNLLEEYF